MKKLITVLAVAVFTLASTIAATAQRPSPATKWISDRGYWVVEGNRHQPRQHTIRFYNNDNVLVYQETLADTRLRINRKKTRIALKKALDAAVVAWEGKRSLESDHYVSLILK